MTRHHLIYIGLTIVCPLFFIFLPILAPANAAQDGLLDFKRYDASRETLLMNIITPTINGEVFLLPTDGDIIKVDVVMLERLFELKLKVKCDLLEKGAKVYFSGKGRPTLKSAIPPQSCLGHTPKNVEIATLKGVCTIHPNSHTLWRVATELSKRNALSVYQNLYGIFVTNRSAFVGDDIKKLKNQLLKCPSAGVLDSIDAKHAERLFKEHLLFTIAAHKTP